MPWIRPLLLTLELMALSTLVAALIGIPLAFAVSMAGRQRRIGRLVAGYCLVSSVACIATPMILHAAAWEATAGKFGWLTFSQTASRTYTGFAGRYGGMVACVWIHGLFGAALVTLATWFGTSRVDPEVIDQSRLDGGPVWAWWKVRLPIAAPWGMIGLLATAILAATEMTVVDLYGVRTLADEFYLFHAVQPSMISILMVLVLPVVLVIGLVATLTLARRRRVDISLRYQDRSNRPALGGSGKTGLWSCLAAPVVATLLYAFPLGGLIVKTGQEITVSTQAGQAAQIRWSPLHSLDVLGSALSEFSSEYQWTLVLAVCTALCSVPLGGVLASVTRGRPGWASFVQFLSIVMFMIPGPIIGLALVHLFTLPVPGFATLYRHSLVPTVAALSVRAIPICYWITCAGYAGIESRVMDVARIDLSWIRRVWTVDVPLLAKPLVIATLAAAVVSSGDVPATLPVLPPGVVTVGTRLFALLHSGARNQEAALAFWLVGPIVAVCIALSLGWKRSPR
jgi:iron(III) transport system permease protein